MAEVSHTEDKATTSYNGGDSLVAGKSLNFYWRSIRWFILIIAILDGLNIVFQLVPDYGHWVIEVAVFLVFNFWLLRIRRIEMKTVLTANILLGLGAGLLLAIFEIIWYHQVVYLLNLIRQPVIVTALGIVSSLTFYLLFKSLLSKKDNNSKGGGIHGRTTNVNN